jgi:hypothetical protein
VNVNTEAKMNIREDILAKDMNVELGREKSREGGIRPFARGTLSEPKG